MPFNAVQAPDLSDWIEGGAPGNHPHWQNVLEALGRVLNRPALGKLAETLANASDDAKRAFVAAHPDDPFAALFAEELEAVERKRAAFKERMRTAQKRVNRRANDATRRLKACEAEFEKALEELRAGRPFPHSDPVQVLDDNVAFLEDQIDTYKKAADEDRLRAAEALDEVMALKSQVADLTARPADVATAEAEAELAALRAQLAERDAAISVQVDQIVTLEADNAVLTQRSRGISLRSLRLVHLAAAVPVLALGIGLGPLVFGAFDPSRQESGNELKTTKERLQRQEDEFLNVKRASEIQIAELKRKTDQVEKRSAELEKDAATLKAEKERAERLAREQQGAPVRMAALSTRDTELNNREADLKRKTDQAEKRSAELEKDAATLKAEKERVERLAREQQGAPARMAALSTRETELSNREADLKRKTDQADKRSAELEKDAAAAKAEKERLDRLAREQQGAPARMAALDRRETGLNSREAELNTREADLKRKTEQAEKRSAELEKEATILKNEKERLARDQQSLPTQLAALNRREIELNNRDADLKRAERRVAELQTPSAGKSVLVLSASSSARDAVIRQCDDMAAVRYDPDRPTATQWKDSTLQIPVKDAVGACQKALENSDLTAATRRRVTMQLGRTFAAQGAEQAREGNTAEANRSFERAVQLWTDAAKLGSGQAYSLLGAYYRGDYSVKSAPGGLYDPPKTKDLRLAWENVERAATLEHPIGLTNAGYYSLFPDWFDNITDRNDKKGREYLEAAQRFDSPYANYVAGLAMLYGRGYDKNESEGLRLINLAYCKKDSSAIRFFEQSKSRKPPAC